jgi:hypothetical protein
MVQLDCGLVRTEGLPPPPTVNGRKDSTEGRDGTEGGVCVGRKEGFWMVDGAGGLGSDRRVSGG